MEKKIGVYAFWNPCIRDPLPPHNLLFKIGGGIILDRFSEAEKAQGTYIPFGYEIICAKVTGENWREYEKELHKIFDGRRIITKPGSRLGTEWFRVASHEQVIEQFNKIPGEWYSHEMDVQTKPLDTYDSVKQANKQLNIRSSHEYFQSKDIHPNYIEEPKLTFKDVWVSWYDFLGVDVSKFPKTKQEWTEVCKQKGIRTWEEYRNKKDIALPENPGDLYEDWTNPLKEFEVHDEIIW